MFEKNLELTNFIENFAIQNDCSSTKIDEDEEGNLHIFASFKDCNGEKRTVGYFLNKFTIKNSKLDLDEQIKYVFNNILKPQIDECRIREEISWEELLRIAANRDFLRNPKIFVNKKRIEIRCHTHPSYDENGEVDYEKWDALFCKIENGIITDTFLLEKRYRNVLITDIEGVR